MEDWVHRNMEMFEATLLRIEEIAQTFDDFLRNALLFQCWYRRNGSGSFTRIEIKTGGHVLPHSHVNVSDMVNVNKLRKAWMSERDRLAAKMGDRFWGLGVFILQAVEINVDTADNHFPPLRLGNDSYFLPFFVVLTSDCRRIVNVTGYWLDIFLSHSDALKRASSTRFE